MEDTVFIAKTRDGDVKHSLREIDREEKELAKALLDELEKADVVRAE